jgi:hypothetical protein
MPAERKVRKPDGASHPYSKPEVKPEVCHLNFSAGLALRCTSLSWVAIPMGNIEPKSLSLARRILLSDP